MIDDKYAVVGANAYASNGTSIINLSILNRVSNYVWVATVGADYYYSTCINVAIYR